MPEIAGASSLVDADVLSVLKSRMSRGDLVLFTGAGFSRGATSQDGRPVPGAKELKELLWPIAFPGEPVDDDSTLGDVYGCAIDQSPTRVADLLNLTLRVSDQDLPDYYRIWFSAPWARIYTLNIDNLDEAVQAAFVLPQVITPVSPSQSPPNGDSQLWSVHLNGSLDDVPDVTFSPPQYGARSPGKDPWYATLVSDLLSRSCVFVGTTLNEPPLWEHLELRGQRPPGRELRPRSFLVTRSLDPARKRLLRGLNISHIPMSAEQFAEVLASLHKESEAGHAARKSRSTQGTPGRLIENVADLRQVRGSDSLSQYLLGREPQWTDITEGYAIERSFETDLMHDSSLLTPRITLITGTAGTGKSTSLRRIALALEADGHSVGWVNIASTDVGIPTLRQEIIESGYDFVVVDDIDLFGRQAGPFLRAIAAVEQAPRIITAARSTRAENLRISDEARRVDVSLVVAPPLTDSDIDGLIDQLSRAGLLGVLAGKHRAEQRLSFSRLAGRQLLVAMIEATSGERFDDRIDDECGQLPPDQALVYAIVALATRHRFWLTLDEILSALGKSGPEQLRMIDALKRQHLLVEREQGGLSVRHRVIAERAVFWFRRQGQLAAAVEGLTFSMAVQFARTGDVASRGFRLLVRLINHKFMIDEVRDVSDVRSIYESLATLLAEDFHYWLQRGAFETATGDLALAENYLNQARSLAPDDYRVLTEWSLMSLRRAAEWSLAGDSRWRERGDLAMAELRSVIDTRGSLDPYPYHVLGAQGLHFVRRAPLTVQEKIRCLDGLRKVVARGSAAHPDADDLKQLRDDLESEYLHLATDAGPSSTEHGPPGSRPDDG